MWDTEEFDDPKIALPNSYAAQVMRRAVLVPLLGRQADRAAIVAASASVRAAWRDRVIALETLGWGPAHGERKWPLGRCRRAFTLPDPRARCCGQRTVCPDCWGRQVLEVWKRIDGALFPLTEMPPGSLRFSRRRHTVPPFRMVSVTFTHPSVDHVSGVSASGRFSATDRIRAFHDGSRWWTRRSRLPSLVLFERVLEYPLPFAGLDVKAGPEARSLPAWLAMRLKAGALKTATGSLQNRAAELRRFAALGCVGILDVTCPRLDMRTDRAAAAEGHAGLAVPESGRSAAGWRAQVRQVFVVPRDRADKVAANERISGVPHPAFGIAGTVRLVHHNQPSRRRVMTAVARAMAYPKMLLHGPAELTLEVLQARAPYRLFTTTGTFRMRDRRPEG
jgi:hypothetical protein